MNKNQKSATGALPKFPFSFPGLLRAETEKKPVLPEGLLVKAWRWLSGFFRAKACGRRLQVTASAPLGEKRFVAVVKVDGREFLVGGGASNVVLLAQLNGDVKDISDLWGETAAETSLAPEPRMTERKSKIAVKSAAVKKKPSADKKLSTAAKRTAKKVASKAADAEVRMPRISAKLTAAPALGRFVKPPVKKKTTKGASAGKTKQDSDVRGKANSKTRK